MDKRRVLVLNCDSFAAVSSEDSCAKAGFKLSEEPMLYRDFIKGPRFNRMMSLPAMLSEHVLFNAADIFNYQLKVDENKSTATQYHKADKDFLSSFKFYTRGEFGSFDTQFIKKNFDDIFYFMHSEFDSSTALNEELSALIGSDNSSSCIIFNFRVKQALLKSIVCNESLIRSLAIDQSSNEIQPPLDFGSDKLLALRSCAYTLCKVISKAKAIFMLKDEHETDVNRQNSAERMSSSTSGSNAQYTASSRCSAGDKTYADAEQLLEFFNFLLERSLIEYIPFIEEIHNGYLNFRALESTRSLAANIALIERINKEGTVSYSATDKSLCSKSECALYSAKEAHTAIQKTTQNAGAAMQLNLVRTIKRDSVTENKVMVLQRPISIAISSELFVRHPLFGVSPLAARLLCSIKDVFPDATIKLVFNDSIYSFISNEPLDNFATAYAKKALEAGNVSVVESDASCDALVASDIGAAVGGSELGMLAFDDALSKVQELSKHHVSKAQLSDDLCVMINSFLNLNIKAHLLLKHGGNPLDAFSLEELQKSCEFEQELATYLNPVAQCLLFRDYSEFVSEDIDLLISDRFYEQMLALGSGKAVFGISNDVNLTDSVDFMYYTAIKALSSDFAKDLMDIIPLEFERDRNFGMTRLAMSMGSYKKAVSGSFGIDNFVCHLPLSEVVEQGLQMAVKRVAPSWGYESLPRHLDAFYKDRAIFFTAIKALYIDGYSACSTAHKSCGQQDTSSDHDGEDDIVDAVVSARMRTAQVSNYTEANRYRLQWLFLSYFARLKQQQKRGITNFSGFNVLSFGCSRGREACDLTAYFTEANIFGVDINKDAIDRAKEMCLNLSKGDAPHVLGDAGLETWLSRGGDIMPLAGAESLAMHRVEVMGCRAWMGFATTETFFDGIKQHDKQVKFDVVTVMTVLCRHPDTVNVLSSAGIYPFADFDNSLKMIDSLLDEGGLICLFNGNYDLKDSSIAERYVQLFPFYDEHVTLMAYDNKSPLGLWSGDDVVKIENTVRVMEELSQSTDDSTPQPQCIIPNDDKLIELPKALRDMYLAASPMEKFGYVTLFDKQQMRMPMRMCGTIFMKISN